SPAKFRLKGCSLSNGSQAWTLGFGLLVFRREREGDTHTFLNAVTRAPAELCVRGGTVARPKRRDGSHPVRRQRRRALEHLAGQLNAPSGQSQEPGGQVKNAHAAAGTADPFHIILLAH